MCVCEMKMTCKKRGGFSYETEGKRIKKEILLQFLTVKDARGAKNEIFVNRK